MAADRRFDRLEEALIAVSLMHNVLTSILDIKGVSEVDTMNEKCIIRIVGRLILNIMSSFLILL